MDTSMLLVEEHDAMRNVLRDWLQIAFPSYDVIEAVTDVEAVEAAQEHSPRIVLVDAEPLGASAISLVRSIKRTVPSSDVVVLAAEDFLDYRDAMKAAGASLCVLKWNIRSRLQPKLAALLAVEEECSTAVEA